MTNVKDRRREPKGIPTGGRFANENGGGMDASDLDEQEPAFDPKHLTDDDILALRHAKGAELEAALALDEPNVDRRLAFNPNLGWDDLNALRDRQTTDAMRRHILDGMCANPASEGHHMELLAEVKRLPAADRRMAWTCMAQNPRLDPKAAARIALDMGTTRAYIPVAETLAGSPRLTDETLAQLVLKFPEDSYLLHRVISNPAAGDNALIAAANRSRDGFDVEEAWSRVGDVRRLADVDVRREPVSRGLARNRTLPDAAGLKAMIGEGPVDPDLARGIAHAPTADASTLIRLARACTRNARIQTEILRASACDDFVRGALGTVSEDPGIRQLAWSTMRDPNGLGLADLSDRPSLIGVCANPRMTEAVAGEIVRKAGVAAATRLRDNESLPEEFRRGLVAAAGRDA